MLHSGMRSRGRHAEQLSPCGAACSETYQYYSLPFCEPKTKEYKSEGLGQVLAGDRTVNSLYVFDFAKDSANSELCTKTLSPQDVAKFRNAVASEYYFQVNL